MNKSMFEGVPTREVPKPSASGGRDSKPPGEHPDEYCIVDVQAGVLAGSPAKIQVSGA